MLEPAQFTADSGAFIADFARQNLPNFLAAEKTKSAVKPRHSFIHRRASLARFGFTSISIVDRQRRTLVLNPNSSQCADTLFEAAPGVVQIANSFRIERSVQPALPSVYSQIAHAR